MESMTPTKSLKEGLKAQAQLKFTNQDMQAFADLSRDQNPIHSSDAAAKACGFKGRVVYGGLIIAAVSRLLGMEIPGPGCIWHSLSMQFKNPLYVDETAELTGIVSYCNTDLGFFKIDLKVMKDKTVIAKGEAQSGCKTVPS
jgi:acyl dehydratase